MAIIGHGGTDIVRQLVGNVVNIFKKKRAPCTSPCDGLILKMHYQWTFWLLLAGFSAVWYSWYHRDVITCVSHFNAETQVRLDYINICLSYPYVEEGTSEKRFLLFYRWIHWTLLVLAGIYYIPRKISKNSENPKVKKLIEDLAVNSHRYDQVERELVDRAARYIAYNLKTHNGLYYKFVTCNLVALVVDIISFQFLDFVFQGRFMHYGWMAYPYSRDPVNFSDYMSRTFPPFAKCDLGVENKLVNKRTEKFGCHLTVMELYEKVFLGVWVWLILLTTITCAYLIFLGFMWLPYFRLMMLKVAKPLNAKDTVSNTIVSVVNCCKIGDVYLLYRLKQHLSHARFYELLTRLSDPELIKTMLEDPADRAINAKNHDMRGRKQAGMGMAGPKGKFGGPNDLFISQDYGRPNTSILVE
ncbi:innexin inx2-like isoform X4 [Penaeus indicus]|uniref:innexin inx2-like isoform X4 n=1 Tax=Penaeus indicus TaxID=29960 RepID=UPI00300C93B8